MKGRYASHRPELLAIRGRQLEIATVNPKAVFMSRMHAILSSLQCECDELAGLLRRSWQNCLEPTEEASSVDKAVFAFHPSVQ